MVTRRTTRRWSLLAAMAVLLAAASPAQASTTDSGGDARSYIVRHADGTSAARAVTVASGGRVAHDLGIIGGVAADLAPGAAAALALDPAVSISDDAGLELHSAAAPASTAVSLDTVRAHVRATPSFVGDLTGRGVDIALIDSGITPVKGMTSAGQVVNGPDLSFESTSKSLRHLDTYGHGTHLAGIINATADATGSAGIAPGSRIVSLKVADATGATDVSQVIAGIDWVVQHKNDHGLNIRVLALAFGTDGVQASTLDPLAYAAEVAWRAGVVVVVAAGNSGETRVGLTNPAIDPFVVAVGAADTGSSVDTSDDQVPAWSAQGNRTRIPDVAAPGVSVVSLRVPGSYIDANFGSTGREGTYGFKGSGTSQATAVTAAMAALILESDPSLMPDQVKYGLMNGARDIASAPATADGSGLIDFPGGRHRATQTPAHKTVQKLRAPRVAEARSMPLAAPIGCSSAPRMACCAPSRVSSPHSAPSGPARPAPRGRAATGRVRPGPVRAGPAARGMALRGPVRAGRERRGPERRGPERRGPVRAGPAHRGPAHRGPVPVGAPASGAEAGGARLVRSGHRGRAGRRGPDRSTTTSSRIARAVARRPPTTTTTSITAPRRR